MKDILKKTLDYFEFEHLKLVDYFGDEKHPEKIEEIEIVIDVIKKAIEKESNSDNLKDFCMNEDKLRKNKISARISKDEYYLNIALEVSKRSTCLKRHYGCVIVKDDIIIATGYNGSPRGEENCCDRGTCKRANAARYSGYESCDSVHAEQNALIAASRDRLMGSIVYLACEEPKELLWYEDKNPVPCNICKRMLKNAGVSKIINRSGEICS